MKNQSENKVYTLAEVLGKHTIAELKQMTQVLEVKVLSKAKKQEIIDALSAKLLDKELLTAWLLAAGKQEIEELELAMAEDVVIAEESGRFYYWRNLPVVFVTGDGVVVVPIWKLLQYIMRLNQTVSMHRRDHVSMCLMSI